MSYSYDAARLKAKIAIDKYLDEIMQTPDQVPEKPFLIPEEEMPASSVTGVYSGPPPGQIGSMGSSPKVTDLGISIGPGSQLAYSDALESGCCMYCKRSLKWNLRVGSSTDDRFCYADCCGKRFWMIPKSVTIQEEPAPVEARKMGFGSLDDDDDDVQPPPLTIPSITLPSTISNLCFDGLSNIKLDKIYLDVPPDIPERIEVKWPDIGGWNPSP